MGGADFNCCPLGEPCPPPVLRLTHPPPPPAPPPPAPAPPSPPPTPQWRGRINKSLALLPRMPLPRSAAPCFPFISTVFDVGFIILCQPPNQHLLMPNCVRFVAVVRLFFFLGGGGALVGLIHFKHLAYLIDSDVAMPIRQMLYAHAISFRFKRQTIEFYLYEPEGHYNKSPFQAAGIVSA